MEQKRAVRWLDAIADYFREYKNVENNTTGWDATIDADLPGLRELLITAEEAFGEPELLAEELDRRRRVRRTNSPNKGRKRT